MISALPDTPPETSPEPGQPVQPVVPAGFEKEVAIAALHRYWLWSDVMQRRFFELLPREEAVPGASSIEEANRKTTGSILYGSYWLASLYIVVEGWRELHLEDPAIDALLENETMVSLLRRHRNGVFHFQRNFGDRRIFDLFEAESRDWEVRIHAELGEALGRILRAI